MPSLLQTVGVTVFLGMPALSLVCLVLAIRWRRRSPLWLPVAGAVAMLALATYMVVWPVAVHHAQLTWYDAISSGWLLLAFAMHVLAAFAVKRQWPSRGAWVVASFAVPAPLALLLLYTAVRFVLDYAALQ